MRLRGSAGFTLLEMLISLTVLLLAMSAVGSFMIHNSRINKSQQMAAEVQSNARNCLAMVVQKLRTAGWDPMNVGIPAVTMDPDTTDDVSQIEVFADLNADAETDGTVTDDDLDEQVLIRHINDTVEWRRTADPNDPFIVLAVNISNDADGDGTIEPMFVGNGTPPTAITVQVTAESPVADPISGEFIRYTVNSEVVLRSEL